MARRYEVTREYRVRQVVDNVHAGRTNAQLLVSPWTPRSHPPQPPTQPARWVHSHRRRRPIIGPATRGGGGVSSASESSSVEEQSVHCSDSADYAEAGLATAVSYVHRLSAIARHTYSIMDLARCTIHPRGAGLGCGSLRMAAPKSTLVLEGSSELPSEPLQRAKSSDPTTCMYTTHGRDRHQAGRDPRTKGVTGSRAAGFGGSSVVMTQTQWQFGKHRFLFPFHCFSALHFS